MASLRNNGGLDKLDQPGSGLDKLDQPGSGLDQPGSGLDQPEGALDPEGGHAGPARSTGDDALLDAARASIVAVGWRRSTLTDVARRAGVSRMTIYRRWPDMQTLLADLMTREWSGVVEDPAAMGLTEGASVLDRIVGGVGATVSALRDNELFRKILEVDPELLLPYLLDRRGRTQDAILGLVEAALTEDSGPATSGPATPG